MPTIIDRILSGLTVDQKLAVETTEGPIAVIAGPGSGKTRVVTVRSAYLVTRGVPVRSILSLTFTNKAAGEMRDRVKRILADCNIRCYEGELFFLTFHSFCLKVLRRFADRIGYSPEFTVLDEDDQRYVFKEIGISDLNSAKRYSDIFSKIKCSIDENLNPNIDYGVFDEAILEYYNAYNEYLRRHNLMDFDDLLVNALLLFRTCGDVLSMTRNRFKYIMVDEYQDTNRVQYYLIKVLAEEHRNILVVGDEDQSIYSWRNADIRNILDFEKDFPEVRIIFLRENFRSTENIVKVANALISKNVFRKEKTITSVRGKGEKVKLYCAIDERDEARFVVSTIKKLGLSYSNYAVFYRTNAQSRVFEEELIKNGIPYVVVGGFKFYERKEIKDMLAYVRFILNPNDLLSLERIINVPPRGIGKATFNLIREYMDRGLGSIEAMKHLANSPLLMSSRRMAILDFVKLIEEMREKARELTPSEFMLLLFEKSGYKGMLEELGDKIEADSRISNIRELINFASEYDDVENGLKEFIDRVSLISSVDEYREGDFVTLMTLHSAKGLEFPVVFVTGIEEGLLPHAFSEGFEDIEEERRLFYVGITRAKDMLFLSYCKRRFFYGKVKHVRRSRFLDDIPELLLEVINDVGTTYERKDEYKNSSTSFCESSEGSCVVKKGDTVEHPLFGKGKVLEVYGEGESQKVLVRFEKVGVKLLAVSFAKLRKLW